MLPMPNVFLNNNLNIHWWACIVRSERETKGITDAICHDAFVSGQASRVFWVGSRI